MRLVPTRPGRTSPFAFAAWTTLASGVVCATCVGALVVDAVQSYDDDTARTLMLLIGASAGVALLAAVPGLREPRFRPIAMEGVELAFIGVAALTMIAFFVYVVFDGYVG